MRSKINIIKKDYSKTFCVISQDNVTCVAFMTMVKGRKAWRCITRRGGYVLHDVLSRRSDVL